MDYLGSFRKLEETGAIDRLTLGWLGEGGSYGVKPARVYSFELVGHDPPMDPGDDMGGLPMELAAAWLELPLEEREIHAREGFFLALDQQEKFFPERGQLFLAGVAAQAIRALEEALESGQVSWDNPTIEARFLATWNFEYDLPSIPIPTAEDLETFYGTHSAFLRLVRDFIARRSFLSLHGLMWLRHHDDGQLEIMIPAPMREKARRENPTPEAELKAVMEMARPIQWPMAGIEGDGFTAAPIIAFAPCHIAEKEGLAFYPVLVHLEMKGEDCDPRTWPAKKRAAMWGWFRKHLLLLMQTLTEDLDKKAEAASAELRAKAEGVDGRQAERAEKEAAPAAADRQPKEEQWRPAPEKGGLAPAPSFGTETRILFDGPTRYDRKVSDAIANLTVRLPKRLDTIPRFEDEEEKEIARLRDEHGEDAFRKVQGGVAPRGPLLTRKRNRDGEAIVLSPEARESLLSTLGNRVFRRTIGGRELLVRRVQQARGGFAETGWALFDRADLATKDGQSRAEAKAREFLAELDQDLFATPRDKEAARQRYRIVRAVKAAPVVMDAILRRYGAIGRSPVHFPAWELRNLLECDNDEDGYSRVMEVLRALRRFDYFLRIVSADGTQLVNIEGSFLSEIAEIRRGPGQHTDGDFLLRISEPFVGSVAVFETTSHKLKEGQSVFLDWSRKLERVEVERLDYVRGATSLLPYYDKAKGFTDSQRRLVRFVERETTRECDSAGKRTKTKRVPGSTEPRVYGPTFCPLLPPDKAFHGALGRQSKNPEAGRKLKGTKISATKTGGARTEGLLAVMGYDLPTGRAAAKRRVVLREAVEDLRAVIEDAFGGIVAGRLGTRWLTVDEALGLTENDLGEKVRWFLFPAADWSDRLRRDFEEYQAERYDRGEVPFLVKTTRDREEYERSRAELEGDRRAAGDNPEGEPLRLRLSGIRQARGLSQAAVARIFGVSQYLVSQWEAGPKPGEDGRRGKAIPETMAPMVARWIETGEAPTAEELTAARRQRRGVKSGGS